ncbi:MAG: hypothetical protein IPO07_23470 [Haliscomenobacter sp.]|nr:hypothetical protein [Haliscomenobacter sp.]MBK9491420.1 hypothetical protein [Haliscomenobacter sp.]
MKSTQILALVLLLWIPNLLLSQARSFRDFIVAASSPTNPKASATNFKTAGGKDRFLLEEWGKGWALSRGSEMVKDGYAFNFDFEKNELYLRKDDEDMMIVADNNSVRRFVIVNGLDSIRFVKSIAIDKTNKVFFQLIGGNTSGKIALLKLRTSKALPVNKNDYARNFNGDYSTQYRNESVYYFVDSEIGVKGFEKMTRDELLKLFPQHQAIIVRLVTSKKNIDEKTLIAFTNEVNGL